jgi:cell division protein FtsW (lipid II flippase)
MSKHVAQPRSVDTILLFIVGLLVAAGFLIFSSASLGLLARDGASFGSVAFSQFAFGILGGGAALFITSNIYYRHWRRFAFYIFILSLLATAAVFIPGLGMSHGGATRWLNLGITTVQPSEFLKIGFVIYLATWFSGVHHKINNWRFGLVPFLATIAVTGGISSTRYRYFSDNGSVRHGNVSGRWSTVARCTRYHRHRTSWITSNRTLATIRHGSPYHVP